MQALLESLAHIGSIAASAMALLTPAAAVGFGVVPRVGPLRALGLGLSTKLPFVRPAYVASQRTADCAWLRNVVDSLSATEYAVVTGSKGVGKSTVIDTVMAGRPGVVSIEVAAGATHKEIVSDVVKAIARYHLNSDGGAARVSKWHRRIFRVPPTVVLRVRERPPEVQPAQLGGAVRHLVENYKMRVVVDSSDSSLQAMALRTLRQKVVQLELMERSVLEQVPDFQELLAALQDAGVADLVWAVLGGNPALYTQLRSDWAIAQHGCITTVAENFILDELRAATSAFNKAKASHTSLVVPLYDRFKTADSVPDSISAQHELPSPDKVLRRVAARGRDKDFLVPSTAAMAFVLRYSEDGDPPSLSVVRAAVAAGTGPAAPTWPASSANTGVHLVDAAKRLA